MLVRLLWLSCEHDCFLVSMIVKLFCCWFGFGADALISTQGGCRSDCGSSFDCKRNPRFGESVSPVGGELARQ